MQIEILPDADSVAKAAAQVIAADARAAVAQRGRFLIAVSGGKTPWNIHAMPVNSAGPEGGADAYEETLNEFCGNPPVLDLAHLGLGPDGHTASLIPGDPVLAVHDRDVALTGLYQGRNRMTLTYPMLNRSRKILWLATGVEKAPMIARLQDADPEIPAGMIEQKNALLLADASAVPKD